MDYFKRAREKASTIRAYRDIFASEQGKLILKDLIQECHVASPIISDTDRETFLNEGKRNVFLYIMNRTTLDPDEIFKRIISDGQSQGEDE